MRIFAHRIPIPAIAITAFLAAIALVFTFAILPNAEANDLFQALSPELHDCDVQITRYQNSYRVRMDVNEASGSWKSYFVTIDGITNENRGWGAFPTDDGIAFYMPYKHANAGEEHHYFVRVSYLGRPFLPPICESTGSFYVKGDPPKKRPSTLEDEPSSLLTPVPEPEPAPEDLIILSECNITITRYVDSFHVRMDIDEHPRGRMYWPTIDGITNENRGWGAFRTETGIAFIMRYTPANAGEVHRYLVRVAPWYEPSFCESRGTFYVKN